MRRQALIILLAAAVSAASAREYHVSPDGSDSNSGLASKPLRSISAAAALAKGGDTITVRGGVYREEIRPSRGGESNDKRIIYRAAPGEEAVIKGSEVVKGWTKAENDTWKVVIPNSLFGAFNPYSDLIKGDWFYAKGREHHTGAVYLNEHWLTEAAALEDVLKPAGEVGASYSASNQQYLLNVAWFQPGEVSAESGRVAAKSFAAQSGIQTAPCSEGGECIGWIEHGDWVRYEGVDFGRGSEQVEIRAASVTSGGVIEIRLDGPDGELVGKCTVPNTGGWQSWSSFKPKIKPLSGRKTVCLVFRGLEGDEPEGLRLWFAKVDSSNTVIWAQFKGVNPNEAEVEVNVRRSVFYPARPGVNYITVRGFTMMHAATPWAPPTAEQVGLIGTHWSKGWIIEDNDIRYSTCVGVTLGKYGDEYDNTSQDTAEGYVKTIERALENGWRMDNIGGHIVRNNRICHCEQAGIVGSLGAISCRITGNVIHDIHVRQLFTGAEMAGIKLHAAIDTVISRNHIYRACRGIWLDWMAQGTYVTRNLLHDNGPSEDLFVEVNHGPFLVAQNLFLSPTSLFDMSQGGAYAHNLFAGRVVHRPELGRETPYHPAHSTEVAGLHNIPGGDDRFYNNIFVGYNGLAEYDKAAQAMQISGNVFLKGAKPGKDEQQAVVKTEFDPGIELSEEDDVISLHIAIERVWSEEQSRKLVTSDMLGKAKISGLRYEQPDGSVHRIDTDYTGRKRDTNNPFPGPFEPARHGRQVFKVWPF
ncbi:MAG: carbohydrate-binding protein [Sedimentisphaerales bacterium]|nr:carbohydrate-binding protein [Sedimentisphaerales bacterium]